MEEVPLFYVVKRGLSAEHVEAVMVALSITPCQAAFISTPQDAALAWNFAPQVICADAEETALSLAQRWATDVGRPMLVIGEADCLDAVFADGHREALVGHA